MLVFGLGVVCFDVGVFMLTMFVTPLNRCLYALEMARLSCFVRMGRSSMLSCSCVGRV